MKDIILKETIQTIKRNYGNELDNIFLDRVVFGLFFTGVKLSNGKGGISYTPIKSLSNAVCCPSSAAKMPQAGKLKGKSVAFYFEDMFKGDELKKTLGIAIINALTNLSDNLDKDEYFIEYNKDPVDYLKIGKNDYTVVVGGLVPYIKMLKKENRKFSILELDSSVLKEDELTYHVEGGKADEAVSSADCLIITGTTLINDTLSEILEKAKYDCEIVVVGPTVSMYPDSLINRGVKYIGGVEVTQPDELLDVISEGGSGYHFFGKFANKTAIGKKNRLKNS